MKQTMKLRPSVGSCALMVMFSVLCLVVFSLLSLQTALAQQRLSQANAQSVAQWHRADLESQEIFARLRQGELPPGVTREGPHYR